MRVRQIFGYLLLAAAVTFGAFKIAGSGLLDRMGENWITFLGVMILIFLLGGAVFRVLRD